MRKSFMLIVLACLLLLGCEKKQPLVYNVNKSAELQEYESEVQAAEAFQEAQILQSIAESEREAEEESSSETEWRKKQISKERRAVRGIYLTDRTAGSELMESIIGHIDDTELNAVVIDIKNDDGRISYQMNSPMVQELGSWENTIPDINSLMAKLKEHDIYVIARIVTFRDPFLENVRPEWLLSLSDGSVYHDSSGMSWVNPYNREYWEYLAEVIEQCASDGFDELQFDYVRFCTERSMQDVVFNESERAEKNQTEIITEFVHYISDRCAENHVFISTDVFGTIIDSYVDAQAVGQSYQDLAASVDYMSPMIYPSHYGDGNFGISHPDTEPYKTICSALNSSRDALSKEEASLAIVRPWLQGFTASYLSSYIEYGSEQIRGQIQAVYDSGYDEWLVWNASNNYDWNAFTNLTE